ncbi:MAG: apolipoprotein N-acyltransferase [candidate division NC10 bacterium]|nr:apolipoprotein N-acyltransferase [candidate division NC10 bacterium]
MDLTGAREDPLPWRQMVSRGGLAALSGVLLALSFPRFDLAPLAFVALIPLLVGLDGVPPLQGTYLGVVAGTVFSLMSIPWVVHTMTAYGKLPLPVSVLLLVALSLYLALYVGVFAFGVTRLSPGGGLGYLVGAATLWVSLEYLRTFLLTGFPWNLLGYTQYRSLSIIQIASVTGVYGVSFLLVLVNVAVALACLHVRRSGWQALMPALGVGVLLMGTVLFGMGRVSAEIPRGEIRVSVVQGNIEQGVKWDPEFAGRTIAIYNRLTRRTDRGADLIVWPETAVPFFLREGGPLTRRVLDLAMEVQAPLLVGSPDRVSGASPRYYNSAFLISPAGEIVQKYDKMHLVPFGEYVPLSSLLFFVHKMATGIGDFSAGEAFTVFEIPEGRFGVLICFETIFPDQVRRYVLAGADFLVNITNDAWFGDSAAPYQHLSMAALRAVENGVYLVRAANTGISALVAPSGQILEQSNLFVEAVLSGTMAPRSGGTFYTRRGDLFAWGSVLISLFLLAPRRRTGRKERRIR